MDSHSIAFLELQARIFIVVTESITAPVCSCEFQPREKDSNRRLAEPTKLAASMDARWSSSGVRHNQEWSGSPVSRNTSHWSGQMAASPDPFPRHNCRKSRVALNMRRTRLRCVQPQPSHTKFCARAPFHNCHVLLVSQVCSSMDRQPRYCLAR